MVGFPLHVGRGPLVSSFWQLEVATVELTNVTLGGSELWVVGWILDTVATVELTNITLKSHYLLGKKNGPKWAVDLRMTRGFSREI